jgi:hypothetical protein
VSVRWEDKQKGDEKYRDELTASKALSKKKQGQPVEKSMAEVDPMSRDFLAYEKRIDRCGKTDSSDGQRDHRGRLTNGSGPGSKSGSDFC